LGRISEATSNEANSRREKKPILGEKRQPQKKGVILLRTRRRGLKGEKKHLPKRRRRWRKGRYSV